MSRLLRRLHLYLALFLTPWILMYAASTFVMNHGPWFRGPEPRKPPVYQVEREIVYTGELPENATPQQIATQLLASLDLDGAYNVGRPGVDGKLVITRLHAVGPRRITYTPADKRVVVERMVFEGTRFLEQIHRRRGFQHDFVLDDLWAIAVDLTIAALLTLSLTGLWMWWELRVTRRWGALALAGGFGLFALFLAVM